MAAAACAPEASSARQKGTCWTAPEPPSPRARPGPSSSSRQKAGKSRDWRGPLSFVATTPSPCSLPVVPEREAVASWTWGRSLGNGKAPSAPSPGREGRGRL